MQLEFPNSSIATPAGIGVPVDPFKVVQEYGEFFRTKELEQFNKEHKEEFERAVSAGKIIIAGNGTILAPPDCALHDWQKKDKDHENQIVVTPLATFGAKIRVYVSIGSLPEGIIPEKNDSWKSRFFKESVYPPIVIETVRWEGIYILQGNHRVILWREWGFKYAPARVAFTTSPWARKFLQESRRHSVAS